MITEDYVSFEVAKLLKEKGFDEACPTAYSLVSKTHKVEQRSISEWGKMGQVKRPTLQMAMKWLREIHNITIEPHYLYRKEWYAIVSSENPLGIGVYTTNTFNTYEEACEAAIKYCLENLI